MFKKITYWVTTTIIVLELAVGGLLDLIRPPAIMNIMSQLGYPEYFVAILGFWKLLGAMALAAPALPRLKEWAYAGVFFEMSGAAISHLAAHQAGPNLLAPLAFLTLAVASWATRPQTRTRALWRWSGSNVEKASPGPPPSWRAGEPDLRGLGR